MRVLYKTREERAFEAELRRIKAKNRKIKRKRALRAERRKYRLKIKWPTQSKLGMWYIFISCTAVQIYSMAAMWHFADLSPLYALIGATVGEGLTYYAYTAKAKAENTTGGIVYENSLKNQTEDPEEGEG
nr:MAG TPA: hypothetical protein [Caudoviricetes sp.]